MKSVLIKDQKKKINVTVKDSKVYPYLNGKCLKIQIRYDDDCGNGHNSFAITGSCYDMGGCIHDLIAEQKPELKKYMKWHLTASDGPMHYVPNALYHASNKDCWGKIKGEPYNYNTMIKFKGFPFSYDLKNSFIEFLKEMKPKTLTILELKHDKDPETYSSNYTFVEFLDYTQEFPTWYKNVFSNVIEAQEMKEALEDLDYDFISAPTAWGKGKKPDLEAARNAAVWPEAKLEDFTEEKLTARLSDLIKEFKNDVEELDMVF